MAPLIAPSITRELIAAPSSHWPINRGHEFALKPRRIDAASLVDLRHIRHVRLPPPPPPPSCLLHLTVTFDHVSKPCRFNKGTDVGYERRYSRRRSNDGPATVERAYLHFPPPPLSSQTTRFRARNQATKPLVSPGNNAGRINAFLDLERRTHPWTVYILGKIFTNVRPDQLF